MKTLKDIKSFFTTTESKNVTTTLLDNFNDVSNDAFVSKDLLREEAIKWIKEIERCYCWSSMSDYEKPVLLFREQLSCDNEADEFEAIISFIKYFFDITEDDLYYSLKSTKLVDLQPRLWRKK